MKKVGASHADLIACGFAILVAGTSPAARGYLVATVLAIILICGLKFLPRNTTLSRVVAVFAGGLIVAIAAALIFSDDLGSELNSKVVLQLAATALGLCIGLWNWNDARTVANVAHAPKCPRNNKTPAHCYCASSRPVSSSIPKS